MKRATKVLASLAGIVLSATMFTTVVQAQAPAGGGGGQRGGGRGGRGGPMTLARMPIALMKSTLTLTDDQVTKITAIQTTLQTDTAALFPAPVPGTPRDPAAFAANRQKMTDLNTQASKDILAVLTPAQKATAMAYLKDLQIYAAAGIPVGAQSEIKLTADQKKQIQAILTDEAQKTKDATAAAAGDQAKLRQSRQDIRKESTDKVAAVLTAEQKTALEAYIAAHPRGRRGGAGAPAPPAAPATQLF